MTESKTLYRSRDDQMIGGVCAGIADHVGLDPTIVRLIAVFLLLVGNAAVLIVYIVLWAVVPERPATAPEGVTAMSENQGTTPADRPGPDSPPPPPPPGMSSAQPPAAQTPLPQTTPPPVPVRSGTGPVWFGVALIFVGAVLLLQVFVPWLSLWQFWPVVIIVAGVLIIFRRGR